MKNTITLIFLLLTVFACTQSKPTQAAPLSTVVARKTNLSDSLKKYVAYDESIVVLIHANIIDGTGSDIMNDQTIIIENGHFINIGNQAGIDIPPNAKIIDVSGKTIIPGLVGVHNHLHIPRFPFVGDLASKMYLATGLTTIQTCGAASPKEEVELAQQILDGTKVGPDIITSAPYFTGEGGNQNMIIPRDEQHIRDTMRYWINQGVSWFKVYRHTNPDDLKIIIDEAHKNKAKVTGHFCSITIEEAVNMGIDGIEHGLNTASDFRTDKEVGVCNGGRSYMDELTISSPKVRRLHQLMIDKGVYLSSTLSIYESSVPSRAFADERTLLAMSPYLRDQYQERRNRLDTQKQDSTREKRLKRIMDFDYQFFKMGGLLGSGVDAGRHNLFGFGDQRNFELLIEAGCTTQEAVMIMTSNGAKILGIANIGSIEAGKRANFVILNGDLTEDSSIIRAVDYVFKNGIGYNPITLLKATNGQIGLE